MAELRRVAGPSSPLGGRDGRLIAVVVAAILIAIVKPWGSSSAPVPAPPPTASASPSPTAASSASSVVPREPFDFGVFEGFEPPPAWEIWPAGREFSLGFAMRINGDEPTPRPSVAASSGRPVATASAAPEGSASRATPAARDPGPPTWSSGIVISTGSKLTVVAINMPLGYAIGTSRLTRVGPTGSRDDVPLIRLPSPWPDHFVVFGIADGGGQALAAWPAGRYLLDLQIAPGGWSRTIRIEVAGQSPTASPSPSVSPATPAGSARSLGQRYAGSRRIW